MTACDFPLRGHFFGSMEAPLRDHFHFCIFQLVFTAIVRLYPNENIPEGAVERDSGVLAPVANPGRDVSREQDRRTRGDFICGAERAQAGRGRCNFCPPVSGRGQDGSAPFSLPACRKKRTFPSWRTTTARSRRVPHADRHSQRPEGFTAAGVAAKVSRRSVRDGPRTPRVWRIRDYRRPRTGLTYRFSLRMEGVRLYRSLAGRAGTRGGGDFGHEIARFKNHAATSVLVRILNVRCGGRSRDALAKLARD